MYKYISAHGKACGSNPDFITQEIALAKSDRAPEDAWAWTRDKLGGRVWRTISELRISNPNYAGILDDLISASGTRK